MKAFVNSSITKEDMIEELKWHKDQDAIVKGTYGDSFDKEGFRGCAVGCSINSINRKTGKKLSNNTHSLYEEELGIPVWLARVEDTLFEGVGIERSKSWPLDFMSAINVGADLNKIKSPFLIIVLKSTLDKFNHEKNPNVKSVIDRCIAYHESEDKNEETRISIRNTAYAATAAADDTYAAAATAAAYVAAAAAADAAAYAAYVAAAAADTAYAAAYAAYVAAAYAYAADAREKTYGYFSDELLRLIKECK